MRVIWSHTGPRKAGDVTPVIRDSGVVRLTDEDEAAVRAGEPLTYEEGDVIAKFVVEALLHNLDQERAETSNSDAGV